MSAGETPAQNSLWIESHATIGAMERTNLILGEVLRTLKHATETRVGGRLETDHTSFAGWYDIAVGSFAGIT